jgi:hypothetical protein
MRRSLGMGAQLACPRSSLAAHVTNCPHSVFFRQPERQALTIFEFTRFCSTPVILFEANRRRKTMPCCNGLSAAGLSTEDFEPFTKPGVHVRLVFSACGRRLYSESRHGVYLDVQAREESRCTRSHSSCNWCRLHRGLARSARYRSDAPSPSNLESWQGSQGERSLGP